MIIRRWLGLLITSAAVAGAADFCECDWGYTLEQVKARWQEPADIQDFNGCLQYGYTGDWGGVKSVFLFQFTRDGRLARGIIYPQKTDFLAPYYAWVDIMEGVAGPAENRDKLFTDDKTLVAKYRGGDKAATEEMVRAGQLELRCVWESSISYCEVKAIRHDGKVNVGTVSYSKELINRYKKEAGE